MKQILENFKTGVCTVEEVPAPINRPGFVLVRNHYSLISSGTEGGTVKLGQMSLLGKARARPEQARKVMQVAKQQGLLTAYQVAMRALEMPVALGYSSAGEVIEAGEGVDDLQPGDVVACGGAGFANHAEVVSVPRNLCAKVPAEVSLHHAAFTTVGAIAMQSVRIARAQLGENIVIIGLGLVGLLTSQILRAAGCRVFGIDIDPERTTFFRRRHYGEAATDGDPNVQELVRTWTQDAGADAVIITAATEDNGPVALAGELLRSKGRCVVVGRTPMTAPRETYLFKELELCTSMAYGPGTGDPVYEVAGMDYPIGYVRWTENRNMTAFLGLLADHRLSLDELITHEYKIDDAGAAFDLISGRTGNRSTAVLLRYPFHETDVRRPLRRIALSAPEAAAGNRGETMMTAAVSVGVVGAGSFATNEFLPLLAKQRGLQLRGIASATGVRAQALGKRHGFAFCAADAMEVINDSATQAVFLLTRHDTHAPLAEAALRAGKHVFVEKPLALNIEELERVEAAWRGSSRQLMVGFNRRYASLALQMRGGFAHRAQPMSISYCANVGYRPPEHWLHDPAMGGGVILGEACHHIDFCMWLVDRPLAGIQVSTLGAAGGLMSRDNVHIELRFEDGSLALVRYLSNGSRAYTSERVEVFCDNRTAVLTDFRLLELAQGARVHRQRRWLRADKGHAMQIAAFLAALRGGEPVASDSYLASSRVTIEAARLATSGSGMD
ncbi:MAG TPA: bi-domain-containing oxidoreductase [Gammaproteobacteria bacterium]|nr:bi-domain-containing oxidoreductase [Gammaproteobacteria bacterium]